MPGYRGGTFLSSSLCDLSPPAHYLFFSVVYRVSVIGSIGAQLEFECNGRSWESHQEGTRAISCPSSEQISMCHLLPVRTPQWQLSLGAHKQKLSCKS